MNANAAGIPVNAALNLVQLAGWLGGRVILPTFDVNATCEELRRMLTAAGCDTGRLAGNIFRVAMYEEINATGPYYRLQKMYYSAGIFEEVFTQSGPMLPVNLIKKNEPLFHVEVRGPDDDEAAAPLATGPVVGARFQALAVKASRLHAALLSAQ